MSLQDTRAPSPREGALVVLGALVVTVAVYWPALGYYLVNDDFDWLAGTRDFSWSGLVTFGWRDHFYRPLVEVYFLAVFNACGMNTVCLHALSLLLHAANIVLVWRLGRAWIPGRAAPLLAALVFALLPGHTEAVMWVAAVTELLPTLFSLATVLSFLAFLRGRGRAAYVASVAAFAAALAVHESTVMLVPILVVCTFLERRGRLRESLVSFVPFVALLAGYVWLEYLINSRSYLIREGHYRFGLHALGNIANYLVLFYVGRRDVASVALNVLGLVAALVFGRRDVRFAAAWIVLMLLPFSFFTWGISFRYAYLPAVGFALLIAALLSALHDRLRPRWGAVATWAVALVAIAVVARFAVFVRRSVVGYEPLGTAYKEYLDQARALYPEAAQGAVLVLPKPHDRHVEEHYVHKMLQLEYRNPGLRVVFRE